MKAVRTAARLAGFSLVLAASVATASADAYTPGLRDYVRARMADTAGNLNEAASSYRNALAQAPDNRHIAVRSWHQALESGDMPLALQSAKVLDNEGVLPPTGVVLLAVDALLRDDWVSALGSAERMEREENYAFLTPILRSWITLGQGAHRPVELMSSERFASLTHRYVAEHMALQALSQRDVATAARQLDIVLSSRTSMMPGLRISAAGRFATLKSADKALALLPGDDRIYAAARSEILAGKKISQAAMTPAQGFGRLLFRLSQDISSDSSRVLALALARLASFADPANAEYRIGIARHLISAGHGSSALEILDSAGQNRWFSVMAETVRIDALRADGRGDEALALARAIAGQPDAGSAEQLRVANIFMDRSEYALAAATYSHATTFYDDGAIPWSLHLLEGSALERAGQWDAARASLSRAHELAPDEPIILNYLGYAQVERGENIAEALKLLKKASAMRPDDPAITDSLGWAYYMSGDIGAAIPILEKAAAGSPGDATINEHLGDALWAAGRRFEARYAWEAARVFADATDMPRLDLKVETGLTETPKNR